jgi:hypothetical protein
MKQYLFKLKITSILGMSLILIFIQIPGIWTQPFQVFNDEKLQRDSGGIGPEEIFKNRVVTWYMRG